MVLGANQIHLSPPTSALDAVVKGGLFIGAGYLWIGELRKNNKTEDWHWNLPAASCIAIGITAISKVAFEALGISEVSVLDSVGSFLGPFGLASVLFSSMMIFINKESESS